jgi:hypothetical protein
MKPPFAAILDTRHQGTMQVAAMLWKKKKPSRRQANTFHGY